MNTEPEAAESKKRPPISLPFVLIVGVLAVAAYLSGPWIMKQVMFLQERAKQSGGAIAATGSSGRPGLPTGGDDGGAESIDADAIFSRRDQNDNGTLEGEELAVDERLQELDSNADGKVTKEEFVAGIDDFLRVRPNNDGALPDDISAEDMAAREKENAAQGGNEPDPDSQP